MFQASKVIDYIKIAVQNADINYLTTHSFLDFNRVISETTGEYQKYVVAKHHFCQIKVYDSGFVQFSGSIHKMWNSIHGIKAPNYDKLTKRQKSTYKGFNGNQFTIDNIIEIRNYLQFLLGCKPHEMIFQNIEFGVNTTLDFNPNQFIKGLLYHNGTMFENKYNRSFACVPHDRYTLKLYNKSLQYGMPTHSLRVELHYKRMEDLKVCGIKTFADINTSTLSKAKDQLLKRFDEVMYFDKTIDKNSLTKHEKRLILRYANPSYWMDDLQSNHRYREKKKLTEMIQHKSKNLKQQIRESIIQKCVTINRLSKSEIV
ncbi:PH domain-containing protein [Kordia zhangzhouensis]|uniref:hypothetical protein n=1 Tax=Kordia zhangzhouensis TaxID=1620405 RepID=UPI000629ACE6|nr:hypothetical protein [Kordia zhangzhouensis]